jgi:hypothetical protein
MSTAKKTLNATIGAGGLAIEKTRDLTARIRELPSQVRSGSIREVAASVRSEGTKIAKAGTDIIRTVPAKTKELVTEARKRSSKEFDVLAKRGEKLVGTIKRSQPTKAATAQAKSAKSKVKAAATSVAKAAGATTDAVVAAAEKVEEATG